MIQPLFTPETLLKHMDDLNIPYVKYDHTAVFTVAESEEVDSKIAGFHTRNMFLKDKKDRMFLITLGHHAPIDLNRLSKILNSARFSFASPARLLDNLGVTPGSVTPLSILNDHSRSVQLVLDETMMNQDIINMHPLINTMTVSLKPQSLLALLHHHAITPLIIDLKNAAPLAA